MTFNINAAQSWYAVQVTAGQEDYVCRMALKAAIAQEQADSAASAHAASQLGKSFADNTIIKNAFVPKAYMGQKVGDHWEQVPQTLLPGYFIVETACPDRLATVLGRIDAFAKVVKENSMFKPLTAQDVQWINSFTNNGLDPIGMSEGYIKDGVLHIVSGPLLGKEAWVVKVNHRKKVAYLEIDAFGRKVKTQMGIKMIRYKG